MELATRVERPGKGVVVLRHSALRFLRVEVDHLRVRYVDKHGVVHLEVEADLWS